MPPKMLVTPMVSTQRDWVCAEDFPRRFLKLIEELEAIFVRQSPASFLSFSSDFGKGLGDISHLSLPAIS